MTRLIIISEFFHPSHSATAQIISDLNSAFKAYSVDTLVVTNTPALPSQHVEGVVRFTKTSLSSANNSILTKTTRGFAFFIRTFFFLASLKDEDCKILLVSNPPFISLLGPILKFCKGYEYFFLMQDIFPRSAVLAGIIPSSGPFTYLITKAIGFVCCHSASTIVLNNAMKERCKRDFGSKPNYQVIHNWAVEIPSNSSKQDSPFYHEWDIKSRLVVQYSGNFGRLHELLTLLETARMTVNDPISYYFIGGGSKTDQIRSYITKYQLTNVHLKAYQPRNKLSSSLAACDLSVVTVSPAAADTVAPSKFYGILASSKPVIYIGTPSSDIAYLINKHQCGFVVEPGDIETLKTALLDLAHNPSKLKDMSRSAYNLYRSEFGITRSSLQYYQLLSGSTPNETN